MRAGLTPALASSCDAASCSSISPLNFSKGWAPLSGLPLTRKYGVPLIPNRRDTARSLSIFAAYFLALKSAVNLDASRGPFPEVLRRELLLAAEGELVKPPEVAAERMHRGGGLRRGASA